MEKADPHKQFLKAYDQYADGIFRHIYFRIYDREVAKELMQEAFTKTWEVIVKGKKIDYLKAFLYKVAHNAMLTHLRKRRPVSLDELLEKGFGPSVDEEKNYQDQIEASKVIEEIDRLPGKYRDVIRMRYVDDLHPKEIAEMTGISENRISVRIHRAMKKLRGCLVAPSV